MFDNLSMLLTIVIVCFVSIFVVYFLTIYWTVRGAEVKMQDRHSDDCLLSLACWYSCP